MAVKFTVRVGGVVGSTLVDYTPQVPLFNEDSEPQFDAGMQCNNGSACQFQFQVHDDVGEIPRLDLTKNLASHNQVTISEDAPGYPAWLGRGRIADKGIGRGDVPWGDARSFKVTVDDGNTDTRGLNLITDWVRPEESGRARFLATAVAFCNGAPRLTTVISTHLVAAGGEVTMPAKTYKAGDELNTIFEDCTQTEGKVWSVVTHHLASVSHHCFLYIDEEDHTTYASTLSITDFNPNLTTSFPPIWDQGDAAVESGGDNPLSGLVSRYGSGDTAFVHVTQADISDRYDYWVGSFNDSLSQTAGQATTRAGSILNTRRTEHVSHQVTIKIPAALVDLICAGMSINIRSAASMGGQYLGTTQTRRIGQLKWELIAPEVGAEDGWYYAHMMLDRPLKVLAEKVGLPVGPKRPTAGSPEGVTVYEDWQFGEQNSPDSAQAELIAHPVTAGAKAFGLDPGSDLQCAIPNDGFGGVAPTACWALAQTGVDSDEVVCSAGTTYRFVVRHARYSPTYRIMVEWRTTAGAVISHDVIQPTVTPGTGWFEPTVDAVAPPTATRFAIVKDNGAGGGVAVFFDRVIISTVTPAVPGDSSEPVGDTGEGSLGDDDGTYALPGHIHAHGLLSPADSHHHGTAQIEGYEAGGAGDMTKAVYDTDDDGKVDVAEKLIAALGGIVHGETDTNYISVTRGTNGDAKLLIYPKGNPSSGDTALHIYYGRLAEGAPRERGMFMGPWHGNNMYQFLSVDYGTQYLPIRFGFEDATGSITVYEVFRMDPATLALVIQTHATLKEGVAPATPPAGTVALYAKADGHLYAKDDAGTEYDLTGGAPSGAAGGDLSGTYPNPAVVDDSHNHTGSTVPASGRLLLSSDHAIPITFDDILQASDGADLIYASEP